MKVTPGSASKPLDNPYHSRPLDARFSPDEQGALEVFKGGLEHEVEDLVRLELTAEQMVGDEVRLAREYIAEDTGHFWHDLKQGFVYWELAAGQLLLTAADPTRVDWQEHQWWGDEESQFRH
ncbi:MAG TPA: hypothetical protein VLC79_00655 [Cellvibrio sp.]|nr:hypothetical protein [Cellvibrio sp.]